MNFYTDSVALLWTTAMRFGAPQAGRAGPVRSTAPRGGVDPAALAGVSQPEKRAMARVHRWHSGERRRTR